MLHNLLILSFLLQHSCQTMAEGGVGLSVEYDAGKQGDETIASLPETTLNLTEVLLMSADELRTELRIRNVNWAGATKPELQALVLRALGFTQAADPEITQYEATEEPPSQIGPTAPLPSISVLSQPEYAWPVMQPDYSLPPPARSSPPLKGEKSTKALELELQLELRRMELQAQAEERKLQMQIQAEEHKLQMQMQAEAEREQRQFELRKLELQRAQY